MKSRENLIWKKMYVRYVVAYCSFKPCFKQSSNNMGTEIRILETLGDANLGILIADDTVKIVSTVYNLT